MKEIHLPQPPRIRLAQLPTPFQPLRRYVTEFERPRIWIKRDDMTGSAISGNKVRKLEYCIADAIDKGCDTLITCGGVQSNLCRAVALLGAQLGLHVHLVLRGEGDEQRDGNLFLAYLAGADFTYVSAQDYRTRLWPIMNDLADGYAARGHKAYAMGPGASNEVGLWGYLAAAEELKADFDREQIEPGYIVVPTGTTGTVAGLLLGTRIHGISARILGISVGGSGAVLETKLPKDFERWRQRYDPDQDVTRLHADIIDGYAGEGYGKASPAVFQLIIDLARTEGLVLDPVYTAKGFLGMLSEARLGRFADTNDIVFIHTGGIFGLFAQRAGIGFD